MKVDNTLAKFILVLAIVAIAACTILGFISIDKSVSNGFFAVAFVVAYPILFGMLFAIGFSFIVNNKQED